MQTFRPTKFSLWDTHDYTLPHVYKGGGKSQTSTSAVSIPPEVLANYQNVNSEAQQVAQTPFQQYSTDPNAFVAPLTSTQQAGILGTNAYSTEAQPFYQAASNQNQSSTNTGQDYINTAYGVNNAATAAGTGLINSAYGENAAATNTGLGYFGQAAGVNNAATTAGQSGLASAENATQAAGIPISASQIEQYENPYESQVIAPTDALMQQQFNQAQSGQLGNAISNGAFGGDRSQITAAALQGQQALAEGNVNAGLLNQNYAQALGEANTEQQAGLQAANQYGQEASAYGQLGQSAANNLAAYGSAYGALGQAGANNAANYGSAIGSLGQAQANDFANYGSSYGALGQAAATNEANYGSGAQAAGLAGAQAQLTAGQAQQQTEQAGLTALYNQFLQQESYPFQTTQFQSNIAEGTGALSGSTTTSTQPSPYFSDERLKTDIKPIGKTFDGLNIIKYRYKGNKQTHVGLSAQDVEKKHPHAVGLAGGYKTVDYDAATKDAAARGNRASGGGLVVSGRFQERPGFDIGGYAGLSPNAGSAAGFILDPSYLQAQQAAYGNAPWGNAGPVTGTSPYGGKSHVPSSSGSGAHASLAVARAPQQQNTNQLQQLAQGVSQIEGLGKTGQSLYNDAKGAIPGLSGGNSTAPAAQVPPGKLPPTTGSGLAAPIPDPSAGRANAQQLAGLDPNNMGTDFSGLGDDSFAARGGRMRRDAGGATYQDASTDDQSNSGDVPYDSGTGSDGLDIPDDRPHNSLATSQPPSSTSSNGLGGILGDVGSIGKDILGVIPFLKRGGRVGLAGGGSPDVPVIDQDSVNSGADELPQPGQTQSQIVPGQVLRQDDPGGVASFLNRNQGLIVPALHGLGTMASSNSRYLGSAILQGLGGAADSYENTQNEMTNRGLAGTNMGLQGANTGLVNQEAARAKAETGLVNAHTIGANISNTQQAWQQTPFGYVVWLADGTPILARDYKPGMPTMASPPPDAAARLQKTFKPSATPGQPVAAPAGTPPAAPSPVAPHPPIVGQPDPNAPPPSLPLGVNYDKTSRATAQQEPSVVFTGNIANAQARTEQYRNAVTANAADARDARPIYDDMAKTFVDAAHSGAVGAAGAERAAATKAMNLVASKLGAGDQYFGNSDTQDDILSKIGKLQGGAAANNVHQTAYAALTSMASALPNIDKTPDAGYNVTAQLMVRRQQALDAEQHMLAYGKDSNGALMNAAPDFTRANPPGKYNQEASIIQDMMKNHPNQFKGMVDGAGTPQQMERYLQLTYGKQYRPGISRYFTSYGQQ